MMLAHVMTWLVGWRPSCFGAEKRTILSMLIRPNNNLPQKLGEGSDLRMLCFEPVYPMAF
jgi:hypothetical protein